MTVDETGSTPESVSGVSVTPLSGLGTVRWYRPEEHPDPESMSAGSPDEEQRRFDDARGTARDELEVEQARTADRVAESLADEGVEYGIPELGVMIETPAAVLSAPEFAERVDFFSIGTNDLAQYVMAADRENDAVAHLHDPQQPAVLWAIKRSVEAAHDHGAWIGMCGEMAGDPDLTELLVGLGLDELSMSAVTMPAVKANVTDIDSTDATAVADRALTASTKRTVREHTSSEPPDQ